MGFLKKLGIGTALFIAVLSYMVYSPVPDGYKKPWQVHMLTSMMHVERIIANIGTKLGYGTESEVLNNILEYAAGVTDGMYPISGVSWRDSTMDGVNVRIYTPDGVTPEGSAPGILFIHGGGWVICNTKIYHSITQGISKLTNAVVVSVDYRLAPKYVYPSAIEDSLAAAKYFLKHAKEYGVDPNRIAIAGDSAGGQMSASIILNLRDEKFKPAPKLQVLIYPVLQAINLDTPSYQANRDDPVLSTETMASFFALYTQGHVKNLKSFINNTHVSPKIKQSFYPQYMETGKLPKEVLAKQGDFKDADLTTGDEALSSDLSRIVLSTNLSPLLAKDLKNLPQTYIYAAHHDLLRDEALWYSQRLKKAGNDVTLQYDDIGFHGLFFGGQIIDEAKERIKDVCKFISQNL